MHRFPVTIWIASGVLFGLSFMVSFFAWCFIPAFVLLLYGIKEEQSMLRIFWYGTLTGSLQYAGSFFWVWSTFPVTWMVEADPVLQFAAIGFYYVLTSAVVGMGTGVFTLLTKCIWKNMLILFTAVPILWLLSELLKSLLFSLYTFGPGSFISPGFSYGYIGYLLAENDNLLQLAALGGVYILSYTAVLIGIFAYIFIEKKLYTKMICLFVCVLVLGIILFSPPIHIHERGNTGSEVVSLEARFDRTFMSAENTSVRKINEVKKAVAIALEHNPDVIVTPEDVRVLDAFDSVDELFGWMRTQSETETMLIDTGPVKDERDVPVIRTNVYDLASGDVYAFDKKYLVPQGEFLSYIHEIILRLLIGDPQMAEIKHFTRFKPGIDIDRASLPDYVPGVLFCFETMVPYSVHQIVSSQHPKFVVHPISHTWFTNPFSLEYQLNQMLKVHAVWNNVPIVTSGSMIESRLYLPTGEVDTGQSIAKSSLWAVKQFEL